jgi:hypothetical protein
MIKLYKDNEFHYRIFACWYGGYLGNDSWQLNSGVVKITEDSDVYCFRGASGSIYRCKKSTYGTSGYGAGVLNRLVQQYKDNLSIDILPEDTNFMDLNYA